MSCICYIQYYLTPCLHHILHKINISQTTSFTLLCRWRMQRLAGSSSRSSQLWTTVTGTWWSTETSNLRTSCLMPTRTPRLQTLVRFKKEAFIEKQKNIFCRRDEGEVFYLTRLVQGCVRAVNLKCFI